MAMRRIDDDKIYFRINESFGAVKPLVTNRGCRSYPQPAVLVLGRIWKALRLFNVFDGDQADAAVIIVND